MRRALTVVAAVLTAALAAVPLAASGASGGTDARGDVEGAPAGGASGADLVRATAGRASGGRLTHTVTVAGSAADPSGGGVVPQLYIELPDGTGSYDSNGTAECTLFVGRHRGRTGVFRCGYADRVGSARIVRTSASTTRFTFSRSVLGGARQYDWAFITRTQGGERGALTVHDRLPSSDDAFLRYRVR